VVDASYVNSFLHRRGDLGEGKKARMTTLMTTMMNNRNDGSMAVETFFPDPAILAAAHNPPPPVSCESERLHFLDPHFPASPQKSHPPLQMQQQKQLQRRRQFRGSRNVPV
jgi:hypothetical protein